MTATTMFPLPFIEKLHYRYHLKKLGPVVSRIVNPAGGISFRATSHYSLVMLKEQKEARKRGSEETKKRGSEEAVAYWLNHLTADESSPQYYRSVVTDYRLPWGRGALRFRKGDGGLGICLQLDGSRDRR